MRRNLISSRGHRTQTQVADELQISQKHLSKLERGERNPSICLASQISKYYGESIEKLFPDVFSN